MRQYLVSKSIALVVAVSMFSLTACSSDDSATGGGASHSGTPTDGGSSYGEGGATGGDSGSITQKDGGSGVTGDGGATGFTTIFTIVLENHDYAEVVGDTTNAPFLNSLIADYGLATNYMDSGTHPSLPNYLTLISGDTQYPGFVDLDPSTYPFPSSADNLGNQLDGKNVKWRAYAEDMGTACNGSGAGNYAPKHEPFLYFSDTASSCAANNVDYAANFATDLAAGTYKYMYIAPNLVDDGHNPVNGLGTATDPVGSLVASDAWCKTEVGKIMASTTYKNGGVIFITWDEAEGRNSDSKDQVPMIVVSPKIKSAGFKSATAYSHKSYLATVEDILGLSRLTTVTSEPNMLEFFK